MDIEQKERLLETIHEWIRSADQKISIFLAFLGIVFTAASEPVFNFLNNFTFQVTCFPFSTFLIMLSIIGLLLSCFYAIWGLKSRTTHLLAGHEKHNSISPSLLFLNHIAALSRKEFKIQFNKLNKSEYEDEIENQIYANSGVCSRKLRFFNDAIYFFIVSAVCFIFGILNLYGAL